MIEKNRGVVCSTHSVWLVGHEWVDSPPSAWCTYQRKLFEGLHVGSLCDEGLSLAFDVDLEGGPVLYVLVEDLHEQREVGVLIGSRCIDRVIE